MRRDQPIIPTYLDFCSWSCIRTCKRPPGAWDVLGFWLAPQLSVTANLLRAKQAGGSQMILEVGIPQQSRLATFDPSHLQNAIHGEPHFAVMALSNCAMALK
jgi:hypothetical protein